ncbi:sulfotransferase [Lichenibacterium dinghuense]|uniref:sulfotransferase n=1 Tax=Lichenibacterium dinghuense TaxID=2895977 RepID=UPI001F1852E1|nr:sulfotransferase [Lichenibacterium sp. 6Y81]
MATGRDTRRLIAGDFDGARSGPLGVRLAIGGARTVDWTLARLRAARPVVLVSGFWRSGTTWVQECLAEALAAKTVFEPLSPLDPRRRAMLAAQGLPYDSLQAAMPGPLPDDDPLWDFLADACTGRHTSNFTLNCRSSLRESFATRIVVKDVRMPFNLDGFHRRFGVPVLHVRRHPCAVVASLLAADWDWTFGRVGLGHLLPAMEDRDAVLRDCDGDALSRIAAWWAATERHAAASLAGRAWAHGAVYEEVADDPAPAFAALCARLGLAQRRAPRFARVSASTVGAASPRDRWRTSLSRADILRVEAVVTRIHPGCLDAWGGPSA